MKILLTEINVNESVPPLALAYLKAYYKKYGKQNHEIIIKQFSFENTLARNNNLNLKQKILTYITETKPDIIGFSCYTWSIKLIQELKQDIKQLLPKTKIILGGPEITNDYKADYLVIGQGEESFKQILDNENKTNILKTEPKEIVNPYTEIEDKYDVIRFETSRGCPYNCSFCNYSQTKLQEIPIKEVEKRIIQIFKKFNFKHFTLLDANLNIKKNRMKRICEIINKLNETKKDKSKHQKFKSKQIMLELKPELIDEDVIKYLRLLKRPKVELGLQSTDKEVLKASGRFHNEEKIIKGLKLLEKNKINYKIDLMAGLPNDNFFKFLNSIKFIKKHTSQKEIPVHHYIILNNTTNSNLKTQTNSQPILKSNTQNISDITKELIFTKLLNS